MMVRLANESITNFLMVLFITIQNGSKDDCSNQESVQETYRKKQPHKTVVPNESADKCCDFGDQCRDCICYYFHITIVYLSSFRWL